MWEARQASEIMIKRQNKCANSWDYKEFIIETSRVQEQQKMKVQALAGWPWKVLDAMLRNFVLFGCIEGILKTWNDGIK